MTTENRKTARDELASLLDSALTGTGPAEAVYSYEIGDLQGQSPVVMVTSAGSDRSLAYLNQPAQLDNGFEFVIQTWVRQADTAAGWTEQDAENALDNCEQGVAQVVADNIRHHPFWHRLTHARASTVLKVRDSGGTPYLVELIPVTVQVTDKEQ